MKRVSYQWLHLTIGLFLVLGTGGVPMLLSLGYTSMSDLRPFAEMAVCSLSLLAALYSLKYRFSESVLYGGVLLSAGMTIGCAPYLVDLFLTTTRSSPAIAFIISTACVAFALWWKHALDLFGDFDAWLVHPVTVLRRLRGLFLGQLVATLFAALWLILLSAYSALFGSIPAVVVVAALWIAVFRTGYLFGRNGRWPVRWAPRAATSLGSRLDDLSNAIVERIRQRHGIRPPLAALTNPFEEAKWFGQMILRAYRGIFVAA